MLYSALLRVFSTMGDCPSGNPPLCLHIMFVFVFAIGEIFLRTLSITRISVDGAHSVLVSSHV